MSRRLVFFFVGSVPTYLYTLSLHRRSSDLVHIDNLLVQQVAANAEHVLVGVVGSELLVSQMRSEEHTSELQSHHDLVCRLLLEKKNGEREPAGVRGD